MHSVHNLQEGVTRVTYTLDGMNGTVHTVQDGRFSVLWDDGTSGVGYEQDDLDHRFIEIRS